jgi:hypothetical protein
MAHKTPWWDDEYLMNTVAAWTYLGGVMAVCLFGILDGAMGWHIMSPDYSKPAVVQGSR